MVASSMTRGGDRRTDLRPQPSTSNPRVKASYSSASACLGRGQLEGQHQAQAARVDDEAGVIGRDGLERCESLPATRHGVVDEPVLQQLDGGDGGRTGDGVAAIGGAVGALAPGFEDLGTRDHGRERHARGDALGAEQDVRLHAEVLDGPHLARAPRARLDLVGDEQDAVAVAELAQARS